MDETNKIVLEEIRELKKKIEDIDLGLERDREKLQDFNIRLEHVESEVKETRKAVNRSSETIKNKVADVVEPVVGAADSLTTQIKKSKKISIKPDLRPLWKKIFGRI